MARNALFTSPLDVARQNVREQSFGTPEFEKAMDAVRAIIAAHEASGPKEEFCSIDSGVHRTRLLNGKVI